MRRSEIAVCVGMGLTMRVGTAKRAAPALLAVAVGLAGAPAASANPVLLFEPATSRVLYAEDPDRAWHPASVTKLMTAYLTFEAVKAGSLAWDDDVPLSEYARSQPATRMGLRGGIKINVEQAVRGLILRSANDFATALAERVSGSEEKFAEAMNATAKRLGMTRTVFRNPHGLPDPDQVTTARDLALLTMALLKDFPDRAEVFSTPTVRIHKGSFHSQNDLLRTFEGGDGMKTGFTCASGYNVVASATRDGRQLVAVVLGAVNRQKRSERAAELLQAGFAHFAQGGPVALAGTGGSGTAVETVRPVKAVAESEAKPAGLTMAPRPLKDLAVTPADPVPPEDIGRKVRSGKCRGYGGFVKKSPEPAVSEAEAEADEMSAPIVTGSVAATPVVQAVLPTAPTQSKPVAKSSPAKPSLAKSSAQATASVSPPRKSVALKKAARTRAERPAPADEAHGDGN